MGRVFSVLKCIFDFICVSIGMIFILLVLTSVVNGGKLVVKTTHTGGEVSSYCFGKCKFYERVK